MKTLERLVAERLLKIKAVKLQPANPFTWASGWKSPIYNDNRKTLSYPEIRSFIKLELARTISEKYENADAIAGVATGAIAQGALVADLLGLPFVYIRSTPKDHGLENLIEGELKPGSKVVIVEDLVSTGGSSLKAVQAVRNFGCDVAGMVAIFTYGFPVAVEAFKEAKVTLTTLSNYDAVLEEALRTEVKTIPFNEDRIFNMLSDLSNLGKVQDRIPQDKIQDFEFDKDSCSFSVAPVGKITFQIVEREPNKTIKFTTTNSPVPLFLWIQLKQVEENDTRMKITVRAELNPFIKPMVSKPLQDAIDKISTMLASLPY